jgi:SAM-dependent methyltransferase
VSQVQGLAATVPDRGDVERWFALGRSLRVSPGVHRPSGFSAVLAAHLPEVRDATVVDVGSGAGLISLVALARGAAQVVALDRDPRALEDTRHNVARHLGADAVDRVTIVAGEWGALERLHCDLAVANPPQRPRRLGAAIAAEEWQVHDGAGGDGMDAMRALLRYSRADRLVLTASTLLPSTPAELTTARYPASSLIACVDLAHDPVWAPLREDGRREAVGIWCFRRSP